MSVQEGPEQSSFCLMLRLTHHIESMSLTSGGVKHSFSRSLMDTTWFPSLAIETHRCETSLLSRANNKLLQQLDARISKPLYVSNQQIWQHRYLATSFDRVLILLWSLCWKVVLVCYILLLQSFDQKRKQHLRHVYSDRDQGCNFRLKLDFRQTKCHIAWSQTFGLFYWW